jgi:exodeoxyribonuclease V alpha subunit
MTNVSHKTITHSADDYRPQKKEPKISTEQEHAIDLCCDLDNLIVGITGGAGTGKTFVLGKVYNELRSRGHSVALCAPTGRAAKRIQELTNIPAKTVHRLLEFPMPDDFMKDKNTIPDEPKRNQRNPLVERVIIVDESSMVAPSMYRFLMNALGRGSVIRFFGDNNQLPPVEEGEPPFVNVLKERPSVELTFNFRSEDSIVSNALRILGGKMPLRNDRFEMIYTDWPSKQLELFVKDSPEFAEDNHQIIMPSRRGPVGTNKVNVALQLKFNPRGPLLKLPRFNEEEPELGVRPGDKMIWVVNDYNMGLYNGEIGRVSEVDLEDGSLELQLQDRVVVVPAVSKRFSPWYGHMVNYDPRKQIECGYAVTTHKAQGSEFDTVVYVISRSAAFLLNKRNFYTAVTRARKRVIVICDRKAMGISLRPMR